MSNVFDSIIAGLDDAIDDARQKRNLKKRIPSGSYEKESCHASEFRLVLSENSQYDEQN